MMRYSLRLVLRSRRTLCSASESEASRPVDDSVTDSFAPDLFETASPAVTPSEFYNRVTSLPEPFPGSKLLRVSIIGSPNSGKSSIGNALIGNHVFAISKKIHTTRILAKGIAVHGPTQMILSDTPGVVHGGHLKKLGLDKEMAAFPERSISDGVDQIVVVADASDKHRRSRLDPEILHLLYKYHQTPSILVINKADLERNEGQLLAMVRRLTKGVVNGERLATRLHRLLEGETQQEKLERLLAETATERRRKERARASVQEEEEVEEAESEALTVPSEYDYLPEVQKNAKLRAVLRKPMHEVMRSELWAALREETGWSRFESVFVTSAVTGRGLEELRTQLLGRAREADWAYPESLPSDQSPRWQAMSLIRAELLNHLKQEIPYKLKLRIEVWDLNPGDDCLHIGVCILCGRENWVHLIIGPQGKTIRDITQAANQAIRNAFQRDVYLRLAVKYVKSARS